MPLRPMLVAISVDGEVADVPVPQVGPKGYAEAVREFVWKRWTEAGQQLKVLIERNPTDWTCRYAFAVAQELSGDFSDAQKSYLEADRLVGGQDLYCQAGLRRVERHMESFRKP